MEDKFHVVHNAGSKSAIVAKDYDNTDEALVRWFKSPQLAETTAEMLNAVMRTANTLEAE